MPAGRAGDSIYSEGYNSGGSEDMDRCRRLDYIVRTAGSNRVTRYTMDSVIEDAELEKIYAPALEAIAGEVCERLRAVVDEI